MKLGIDIGRVIISPSDGKGDTSFIQGAIEDALNTPPYDGMFEAVRRLVELFRGEVWLVSKCGPRIQDRTKRWLHHHRFFEKTGVPAGNLRFCLQRPQKADHCRELGLTHFIDDRLDVLEALRGVVPHLFLFGEQPLKESPPIPWLVRVRTWPEALVAVTTRLEA